MRTLLITMLILLGAQTVNANPFANSIASDSSKKSSKLYNIAQVKAILASNDIACFYYERKAYLSKGYVSKLGNTKDFCTTKASKQYGIKRLNKNDLTLNARLKLNK